MSFSPLKFLIVLYFFSICTGLTLLLLQLETCFAPLSCSRPIGLVPSPAGSTTSFGSSPSPSSLNAVFPSLARSCATSSHRPEYHDDDGERIMALWMVLASMQAQLQHVPSLWWILEKQRPDLCPVGSIQQSSSTASSAAMGLQPTSLGRRWGLGSVGFSVAP